MSPPLQALARLADGSPASGVDVRVRATINNDQGLLFDDVMVSRAEDGLVTTSIPVPPEANCLKISVSVYTSSIVCLKRSRMAHISAL